MEDNDKKETLEETFPSNSRTIRLTRISEKPAEVAPERKKIEKIVVGEVKVQKRGLGKKLAETFLGDTTRNVRDYILYDVLIPAAKDLISEMVGGGVDMMLFGEKRRGAQTLRDRGRSSYVSYDKASYSSSNIPVNRGRDISRNNRSRHEFDEIVFNTREEAQKVLFHLVDLTIDYKMASVADLYDLSGVDSEYTDNKWGWTDLQDARVLRARGGGYILDLPRAIPID